MRPGDLLVSKLKFACSGFTCKWKEDRKKPFSDRETLREFCVCKGDVVLLVEPIEKCCLFENYGIRAQTEIITFLLGKNLCFITTNEGVDNFFNELK